MADERKMMANVTVWKYRLGSSGYQQLQLPKGARPLSVGEQDGKLMLWALFDTEAADDCETRHFRVGGTGHVLCGEELGTFLGTVRMSSGLVWHVWSLNG